MTSRTHAFRSPSSALLTIILFSVVAPIDAAVLDRVILELPSITMAHKRPVSAVVGIKSSTEQREERSLGALWLRGSSSRSHPKKPYRLEFQDENGNDLKRPFLDLPDDSDWILYPAYRDKTLIRDVLAYDLWREMGYYAPRCKFVELFIVTNSMLSDQLNGLNQGTQIPKPETQSSKEIRSPADSIRGNPATIHAAGHTTFADIGRDLVPEIVPQTRAEAKQKPKIPWDEGMPKIDSVWPGSSKHGLKWENYRGVYIITEKIKRGKERVNIRKLKPEHYKEPDITGGYIFKRDRLNLGEQGFTSSKGISFAYEEPKESEISPAQKAYLTNYVNEFETVLFSERFADPEHGYRRYIDVDSFIDYHWMVEIGRNVDGYTFSVFFHKGRNGKLKIGPLWDWDLSFGNSKPMHGTRRYGWQYERVAGPEYEWYKRLFEDPDFLQRYIDRWAELRTNIFATSNIHARIDQYVAQLGKAAIDRNYKRWPTLGKHIYPNSFVGETYEDEIGWLKDWIEKRLAWIDTQDFPPPLVHTRATEVQSTNTLLVAKNAGCSEVTMAWLVGQVFYTLDGSDPRLSGGAVSPKALEYKESVLLSPSMQMCARVRSEHGLWSAPKVVKTP